MPETSGRYPWIHPVQCLIGGNVELAAKNRRTRPSFSAWKKNEPAWSTPGRSKTPVVFSPASAGLRPPRSAAPIKRSVKCFGLERQLRQVLFCRPWGHPGHLDLDPGKWSDCRLIASQGHRDSRGLARASIRIWISWSHGKTQAPLRPGQVLRGYSP